MLEIIDQYENPWTALSIANDWKNLPSMLWAEQSPQFSPVAGVVDISPMALRLLQLDVTQLRTHVEGVSTLRSLHGGGCLLPGMSPLAQKYAGHQHGVFNPSLGDGRALLLGEVATPLGRMEMYLKGVGRTPYAGKGDGYLGLRSAIREYLTSHALYGLGIPTSLPLSLCVHRKKIMRSRLENAATLLRLAPSHARVGHFEWLSSRGNRSALEALISHLGGCYGEGGLPSADYFFRHAVQRTAHLVAAWQVWGFVHGTLNTDNISVLGMTLDHGTGTFLEDYQPSLAPAHADIGGRYAFSSQPEAMQFGLMMLARSLRPLLAEKTLAEILNSFEAQVEEAILCGMRSRLGLMMSKPEDADLVALWLQLLHRNRSDYTRSFRALMEWSGDKLSDAKLANVLGLKTDDRLLCEWLVGYQNRLKSECCTVKERYRFTAGVNPRTVLREQFLSEVTAAAEEGDFMPLVRLRKRIVQPFHETSSEFDG